MVPVIQATPLVDVASLIKVVAASVLTGAGLVAVFALGLVGVSTYVSETRLGGQAAAPRRSVAIAGLLLAIACFAVVLAGVAFGLLVLLTSK